MITPCFCNFGFSRASQISSHWISPKPPSGGKITTDLPVIDAIYQTRERTFHQDIQTRRSGLKKHAAEYFFN